MSFNFIVRENLNIIEVNVTGFLSLEEFLEGRDCLRELCFAHNIYKVLLNIFDGTKMERKIPLAVVNRRAHAGMLPITISVAVLISVGNYPYIRFMESVAGSQGRKIRVFHSRDIALSWLGLSEKVPQDS